MVMHAHTCPSGQPLGIPIRRASNGHHSQVHIKLKKSHSPPSYLGSDLLLFKYLDLFVELEGVKTISCNMVRLNTFDSMDTKKDDILKKGETTTPKKSKILFWGEYDEPGIYDEFRPHWGPGSKYKPWIHGD